MKKLLLFLMTILSCQFMSAQELTREEEEAFVKDSIEGYENRIPYIEKDCGSIPIVVTNAVVRFEDHAEGVVEFKSNEEREDYRFFIKSNEGDAQEVSVKDNRIYFERLPLDNQITLYYTNKCEEETSIATLVTTVNNQDYINVSSKTIFDLANDWANQKEEKNVGLDQYILNLEGVDRYEKLSFIQDFFLNDNPYPRDVTDEDIVRSIKEGSRGPNECNCKTLELKTSEVMNPGNANLANATFGAGQPTALNDRYSKKSSLWFYDAVSTGPAKKVHLGGHMSGCQGSGYKTFVTQNGPGATGTPLYASLKYSLICVGAQENPGICDCEKTVEVAYRYDTKLQSNAFENTGWCMQKDAYATAEDWAGIITEDAAGVVVHKVEGAMSASSCKKKVNPEFVIGVGAMVFAVAGTIATGGTLGPLLLTLEPQFNTVVKTKVYEENDCKSQNTTQTLLNGKVSLKLKPGKITSATLFSFDAVMAGGYNAFKSEANINSSFHLSTMIPGGKGGELKGCCVAPKGDWLSASMNGPLSNKELINDVNFFLGTNGLGAKTNVGTTVGNHEENCGKIDGIRILK
jgi:hypothetical protein